jgi:hypothetical protein
MGPGPVAFLPLLFGCLGLILCAVYQAQRFGLLFYSFSRFVQHHLDGFGGWASLAGIVGVLSGLLIHRLRGRSWIITCGIVFSIAAFLWSTIALPL